MAAAADLADDRDRFLATYAGKLPQFYLSEASRIYNNAINAATSMIPASIEAAITELNVLGQAIIISYGEKAEIEAVMASRSTWDLREAVETLCAAYMCYYDGEVLTEPLYTADGARHTANTLYRNNNQMMPYSDAILTYAIDTDNKVKKLIASDYSPEKIKGYVAGWSMETKVYSDWFDTFRHFEEVTDYGYLAQVPPSSRNAVVGSNAKVRVNANNRSNVPFTGTIRLYDEDGNQLAASQQITLGVNGYEYIELTFSAQKRGASNERTLSVSYVDNVENIPTRTPFTMTLSQ